MGRYPPVQRVTPRLVRSILVSSFELNSRSVVTQCATMRSAGYGVSTACAAEDGSALRVPARGAAFVIAGVATSPAMRGGASSPPGAAIAAPGMHHGSR